MATGASLSFATLRATAIHSARISGVPCEALIRSTLVPAPSSAAMLEALPVAGPRVATILVFRIWEAVFGRLSTNSHVLGSVEKYLFETYRCVRHTSVSSRGRIEANSLKRQRLTELVEVVREATPSMLRRSVPA